MIYIRKLFTQDLRDGKQIAFPKEPSYDFFKFDYQNNEADRNIEFTFETNNEKYRTFEGKKIQTRLYAAGSESRIDGELKAFIRDELKIEIDDLLILQSDGKNNNKFKFNVILKNDEVYPLYMKIINSANHSLIEDKGVELPAEKIDKPYNRIVFGAPGTGKSNKLKLDTYKYFKGNETSIFNSIFNEINELLAAGKDMQLAAMTVGLKYKYFFAAKMNEMTDDEISSAIGITDEVLGGHARHHLYQPAKTITNIDSYINYACVERVTFHPNYSYAQFVGTYKPITKLIGDKEEISYEYVPGPFIRTFINAKKTGQNVLLLIEEINRANVAAVFGDVFQLLDRKPDGTSEYPITTSEDLRKYLAKPENLGGSPENYKTISIPSNMYIWATMNSADQGVLPMDAAFKRRWDFEYINIDDGAGELNGVTIPIPNGTEDDKKTVKYESIEWNELRKAVNEQLKKVSGVNEDKLLGPFFIGDETKISNAAQNPEQFCKSFKSKVLMYLFEDVVKMQPGELFETKDGSNIHYSDICKDFDSIGLRVFVKSISEQFPAFKDGDAE